MLMLLYMQLEIEREINMSSIYQFVGRQNCTQTRKEMEEFVLAKLSTLKQHNLRKNNGKVSYHIRVQKKWLKKWLLD